MAIISVQDLRKEFITTVRRQGRFGVLRSLVNPQRKKITAVENINFSIERGENVAYLGPNGAGKSTTIKMLTGILVPSAGSVNVNGCIPYKERKRNSYQIGVVFGQRTQLMPDLPAKDTFELLRYMYSIPRGKYNENLKRYTEILEAGGFIDRPVRTLSLGQRMRCEILAALLHDPEILFLDEPTVGLDVVAKERIRNFIADVNREKGVTVLLTTHDLGDIERLCSRVVIIDHGNKIYDGSLSYIRDRLATERRIECELSSEQEIHTLLSEFSSEENLNITRQGMTVHVLYDQRKIDTSDLLRRILAKVNPIDLLMQEEDIESIIRRIYKEGVARPAGEEADVTA